MHNHADIAIIGGEKDFNLIRLASYVNNQTSLKANLILFGENENYSFHFNLNKNLLFLNNEEFSCKSVFIRTDIFKHQITKNPKDQECSENWRHAFSAWLLANPEIKVLNRKLLTQSYFHKANSLLIAKKHGIAIPETLISNSTSQINSVLDEQDLIYKPILGGGHAKELDSKFDPERFKENIITEPFFFQEKLEYPELRVFFIGGKFFSFEINSTELDYRENRSKLNMELVETPKHLISKIQAVNEEIGLSYSACDLKYSSKIKDFKFLEINTSPMFNSFDKVCDYKISEAIISTLIN